MEFVSYFNYGLAALFSVCYAYQLFYLVVSLITKTKQYKPAPPHRYAIVIPARNEEAVIGRLIKSIREQKYPQEYLDIFVVADNCIDQTAEIAKQAGATVWERFDSCNIGKGYALNFIFSEIAKIKKRYDGYLIFDADNLLDPDFIGEMNKSFSSGNRIITCYRNSKNYGSNWISAGYSLWFLREAKYLNNARMILGTSCAVSGTGFLIHHEIIEKNDGWKYLLLTEDIEFTVGSILEGEHIAYCGSAILYDEQPTEFRQAWFQRLRWAKGILQVFRVYGKPLIQKLVMSGNFACYDMTMTIFPVIILALLGFVINLCAGIAYAVISGEQLLIFLSSLWSALWNGYVFIFFLGLITLITEWRRIGCSAYKKITYLFSFPIFMMSFVPISFVALFKKVVWVPIHHKIEQIK